MDKDKLIAKIEDILDGIDRSGDDIDVGGEDGGWWETGVGGNWGADKLEQVINAIKSA